MSEQLNGLSITDGQLWLVFLAYTDDTMYLQVDYDKSRALLFPPNTPLDNILKKLKKSHKRPRNIWRITENIGPEYVSTLEINYKE